MQRAILETIVGAVLGASLVFTLMTFRTQMHNAELLRDCETSAAQCVLIAVPTSEAPR